MGSFGFGLKQSDDAMDWETQLYEAAGLEQYPDDDSELDTQSPETRKALEAALPALLALCKTDREDEKHPHWNAVGYQVLSYILMEAGCAFSDEVRQQLIAGATSCQEYTHSKAAYQFAVENAKIGADHGNLFLGVLLHLGYEAGPRGIESLVQRMNGRRNAINGLVDALKAYDLNGGTPHIIQDAGLLEMMATRHGAPAGTTLH
jgi:hypothetical protein